MSKRGRDIPIILLAGLSCLLGTGACEQLLGITKQIPPLLDGTTDPGGEETVDVVDEEPATSCTAGGTFSNLTADRPHASHEPAAVFFDDGLASFWAVAWYEGDGNDGNIRFMRIGSDGTRFGSDPAAVADTNWSYYPDIAATGDGFGLAWHESYSDPPVYKLQWTMVSRSGVIETDPFVEILSESAGFAQFPSLAWSPGLGVFGLAWQDSRSGRYEVFFATISTGGTVSNPLLNVSQMEGQSTLPDLVWSGSEWAVVWINDATDSDCLYLARIGADNARIGPVVPVHVSTSSIDAPRLVRNATGYAAAWADTSSGSSDILFKRLDWNGNELTQAVAVASTPSESTQPDLVFQPDASLYHLCWTDDRDGANRNIYAVTVDESGRKLGAEVALPDDGGNSDDCCVSHGFGRNAVFWVEGISGLRGDILWNYFSCTP